LHRPLRDDFTVSTIPGSAGYFQIFAQFPFFYDTMPAKKLGPYTPKKRALKDYYAILGVSVDADLEKIRMAHDALFEQYHTEIDPGDAAAVARFQEIEEFFECLRNAASRELYDAALRAAEAKKKKKKSKRKKGMKGKKDKKDKKAGSVESSPASGPRQ
jgi:curved DNA-binding protein CbpA